jgi:hypothetical protein
LFAGLALLAIPAFFERYRRATELTALGLTAVALALAVVFQTYSLLVPIALFPAALALERRIRNIPTAVTASLFIIVAILASIWCIGTVTYQGAIPNPLNCLFLAVGSFAIVPVRRGFRWQPVAGASSLVVFLFFGFVVFQHLTKDKELGKAMVIWEHEAQTIRSSRGVQ